MRQRHAYGWYGKVPCLGDFVRTGLSSEFVKAWDDWMQTTLTIAQEALGGHWRQAYFTAPIWRFAMSAGIMGPGAVAGIMMPSVDRVGRQYPLCLAVEVEASAWCAYRAIQPAFGGMEEAALSMLEDGSSLSLLEEKLMRLPVPRHLPHTQRTRLGSATAILTDDSPEIAFSTLALEEMASIWIAPIAGTNRILVSPNLPLGPEQAIALFTDSPQWEYQERTEGVLR